MSITRTCYLAIYISVLLVMAARPNHVAAFDIPSNYYGAESNPTGNPIGGGEGYDEIFTTGDYIVTNKTELLNALSLAGSGDVIYVANDIDLTDESYLDIPAGVTLAGNRGHLGGSGPRLFSNTTIERETSQVIWNLFAITNANVRITGLRIEGPDAEIRTLPYETQSEVGSEDYTGTLATGIYCNNDGLEVDNCEIYGWGFAGVYASGLVNDIITDMKVHHSYIHHCQRWSYGYGVTVTYAEVDIKAVRFDNCRHAVASSGYVGTKYEVSYSIFHENFVLYPIDSHYDQANDIASTSIKIHHNTIYAGNGFPLSWGIIRIEGAPEEGCWVYNNWFVTDANDDKVYQINTISNPAPGVTVNNYTKQQSDDNHIWSFQNKVGPDEWGSHALSATDRYRVGDVSGDGIDDIVYFAANGDFLVQTGVAYGFNTTWVKWGSNGADIAKNRYHLGYFNNDNKIDILSIEDDTGLNKNSYNVWISDNPGSGFTYTGTWARNDGGIFEPGRYMIADFDGDGQTDILSVENSGGDDEFRVWTAHASTNLFEGGGVWGENPNANLGLTERYKIGDIDGDDDPEILSFESDYSYYYWSNSGTGFGSCTYFGENDDNLVGGRYKISDINNDGKDDVIVYEPSGTSYTRPMVISYQSSGLTNWSSYHVWFETDVE